MLKSKQHDGGMSKADKRQLNSYKLPKLEWIEHQNKE